MWCVIHAENAITFRPWSPLHCMVALKIGPSITIQEIEINTIQRNIAIIIIVVVVVVVVIKEPSYTCTGLDGLA